MITAAFVMAVGSQGAAVALPGAAGKADREFASSFEAGDPAPDWLNTVDTAPDGGKRASGVDGGYTSGIPGNVTDHVTDVRASGENTGASEVKESLVDGEPGTKWLTFEPTGWAEFDLDKPVKIMKYALTSANDLDERDPKDWTLQGSPDGKDWKTLDTRSGESFSDRFQTRTYDLTEPAEYQHFRLDITKNNGGDILQLADVQFSTGDSDGPVPRGMLSLVEVFDVNVAVGGDTQLAYRIFPSMADGDRDYDATNVAVDLAFTDGSLLSDLKATDQHGFELSPQGQGAAKGLYVSQWNNVVSRIGSVAAGKTIDRILVGYDSPKGPAKLRGWLDDVTIRPVAPEQPKAHLSDYALTTRGTNSSGGFSRGNNFPATAVPHGFNFWTPVTNASSLSWLYDYARANNDDNLHRVWERSHPTDAEVSANRGDCKRGSHGAAGQRRAVASPLRVTVLSYVRPRRVTASTLAPMGAVMTTPQHGPATEDTWMFPPTEGWTFDQVKHLELPFDWELVDGRIVVRGQTKFWHNHVRDGLAAALRTAQTEQYRVVCEQCVMVDDHNTPKPDVIVFDPRKLDFFETECVPVERLALVVEVVSPGSRQDDRVRKPALFATAKVPCYWRVELDRDQKLAVHEYWLNADTRSYIPAPMHPVHHDKLVTEVPFPVEIDLHALVGF